MTSKAINSLDYRIENKIHILDIEFKSGGIYRYFNVPTNIFTNLANAKSRGRYFRENIRDEYIFERVC